ncbi:MAG: acyl-CoA reductase [Verrucomicrobiales bacterium]|nr:acyl-CoA reductase [Verrucomicrobiales bacterium]
MDTNKRAVALSKAIGIESETLLELVAKELGHRDSLDQFIPYGDIYTRAHPISPILHIVSGNTPAAAIQTLTRGLLIGALNQIKLPSEGIQEVEDFVGKLPRELKSLIEITRSRKTSNQWLGSAKAIIVFGSDETVREIESRLFHHQIFIPHNHKVSVAIIDSDESQEAAKLAALDVAMYDQQGCLSPHDIYVHPKEQPRSFAAKLANSLSELNSKYPPTGRTIEENIKIDDLRRSYSFRSSNDTSVQIWESDSNTDWTVVYEDEPQFAASPLGRFVFVKPLPKSLDDALNLNKEHLSTIALYPFSLQRAESLNLCGATRICPLGSAQNPSVFWHHDGLQTLAPLVNWTDAG